MDGQTNGHVSAEMETWLQHIISYVSEDVSLDTYDNDVMFGFVVRTSPILRQSCSELSELAHTFTQYGTCLGVI